MTNTSGSKTVDPTFASQIFASQTLASQTLASQTVNAAVVNISGRQRMLSQRAAMFSLMLASGNQPAAERSHLREQLHDLADFMALSHQGLIEGNADLHLPDQLSNTVRAMYFDPPLMVDRQVRDYIAAIRAFLRLPDEDMTPDSLPLKAITTIASTGLLPALDAVVTQYQRESEAAQALIEAQQARLYQERCAAAEKAKTEAARSRQSLTDLKHAQVQLVQAEKMSGLGQLVAGVAHEINNPVSFICGNLNYARYYANDLLGLVDLYQQAYPTPTAKIKTKLEEIDLPFLQSDFPNMLASMKTGGDRISSIVLSLRNFSRLDESESKAVDIHEGLENTLMILSHRLKASPTRSEIQVIKAYSELPQVGCFAGLLNQVFMHLLVNAVEALDAEDDSRYAHQARQITVSTELVEPPLDRRSAHESEGPSEGQSEGPSERQSEQQSKCQWVKISLSDNGGGILPEVKPRIFEPFFTTKPVGQGIGMGLSISYQIITEQHQGTLTCASTAEVGTTFVIQIPVILPA